MSGLARIEKQESCLCREIPHHHKGKLTAIAVAILLIGLCGASYGICGMTPLLHTWKILMPLSTLASGQIALIVVSWGVVSGGAVIALIWIHKWGELSKPFVGVETLVPLETLAAHCPDKKKHFDEVKHFLCAGYKKPTEVFEFYYHLSAITESVAADPEKKQQWQDVLHNIQGTPLICRDRGRTMEIDCTVEHNRLQEKRTPLIIEELLSQSENLNGDLIAIHKICLDAFKDWESNYGPNAIPYDYFFNEGRRPFVVRHGENRSIMGVIILQEQIITSGEKTLFVHTLARLPSAVKMGMTEALSQYIIKQIDITQYAYAWCEVRKNNLPAQYIYKKLGFKIIGKSGDRLIMRRQ